MQLTARNMVTAVLLDTTDSQRRDPWFKRHETAVKQHLSGAQNPKEAGVLGLLYAAADYIDNFPAGSGSAINEDYLASEYLEPIFGAISNLLNYETGRLDNSQVSEAIGYLRTLIDEDANDVGTLPNEIIRNRFAELAARINGTVSP